MSRYRRAKVAGGTFFFTVALAQRDNAMLASQVENLRASYRSVSLRMPFKTIAICVLPDHLHAIWELPSGDADYSLRWSAIKSGFSRHLSASSNRSASKQVKREKGIWQRQFWEHQIRDAEDVKRHIDYIHYNPVKHGLVAKVADWPHSSFHRYVRQGMLAPTGAVIRRGAFAWAKAHPTLAQQSGDQHNLFERAYSFSPGGDLAGKGTWMGHDAQITGLKLGLRRKIAQAQAAKCFVSPDLIALANAPNPTGPNRSP